MLNTISAILNNGVSAVGDYESIQTYTVGAGGQASVTFSSIPSTYTHLQIRSIAKGSGGMSIRLNGDTGSNYTRHFLYGDGSSPASGADTAQTASAIGASSINANIFAGCVIDILDYKSTNKYKTMRSLGGKDYNGSGSIALASGLWLSTSSITSITIIGESPVDWSQYSQFALYGVK